MNKHFGFLFVFLTLICFNLSAQFQRGSFLVGGSMAFDRTNNDYLDNGSYQTSSTTTSFSVLPQGGYFIIDNLAAGLGLSYSRSVTKVKGNDTEETDVTESVAPFVRYYYHHFYAQGGVQFGLTSSKYIDVDGSNQTSKSHGWKLGAGYAWMVTNHIGIEPQIGYSIQYSHQNGDNQFTSVLGGLYYQFGIQFYLFKK